MTPFDAEVLLKDGARLRALATDLVRGMSGGGADADDLVQETWLRALAKPVRAGFSPRAWTPRRRKRRSRSRSCG